MLIFPNKRFITVISINWSVYSKKKCTVTADKEHFHLFCCLGFFFKANILSKMGIKISRDKHTLASADG